MLRVTIFNENIHETRQENVRRLYPEGMHGCLKEALLRGNEDKICVRTATLEEPSHGLTKEVLAQTDVLVYWSHWMQEEFSDAVALDIAARVKEGMGLIALHSAHFSKMMKLLLGTSMTLRWQHGDRERLFVTNPRHPIAKGIPAYFELPIEEMYGEFFDIPTPEDVIFTGWFAGGEVFRSGCTFKVGKGRIFYFQPGHEEYPIYHNAVIQEVIRNGVWWCAKREAEMPQFSQTDCTPVRVSLEKMRTKAQKISFFYEHVREGAHQRGLSIDAVLKECSGAGISGLEMEYKVLKEAPADILLSLARAHMEVSCVYEFFDFETLDQAAYEAELARGKEMLEHLNRLQIKKAMIIPGFLKKQEAARLQALAPDFAKTAAFMENSKSICQMRDALAALVALGQELGITLCIEDFDSAESPIARISQIKWFLEEVPGLGFTLDMGNFAYSKEDVRLAYELLKERIVHVHCKDRGQASSEMTLAVSREEEQVAFRGEARKTAPAPSEADQLSWGLEPVPTGGGYLPIAELIKALQEKGYEGYLAIEHFGAADQIDFMEQSAAFLRGVLGEACS